MAVLTLTIDIGGTHMKAAVTVCAWLNR